MLVDDEHAGRLAQDVARFFHGDRVFKLDVDRFRMRDEHRHAHASGGEANLGIKNLLGLRHHLPFLLGEAVFHEDVDLGNEIEGDALGEFLRLHRIRHEDRAGLLEQFVHRLFARARHRLIGRDDDARDLGEIMQRLEGDHELRGRAIGVGDDVLLPEADNGVGVHLRHDQRHI